MPKIYSKKIIHVYQQKLEAYLCNLANSTLIIILEIRKIGQFKMDWFKSCE